MNTNENVKLVVTAWIDSREMFDLVSSEAHKAIDGDGKLPEELADMFTLNIYTRPSGSKYGVLNFA